MRERLLAALKTSKADCDAKGGKVLGQYFDINSVLPAVA